MTENKEKAQSSHITNFLRNIINEDLKQGVNDPRHWCGHPGTYTEQMEGPIDEAKVRLRFPPEPNGYLHIGHAKSICLNFGLAKDYAGRCHMRFDDTNPVKEDQEYVDSILGSVNWLGFDWKDAKETNFYFASDYFDYMYEIAEHMIKNGLAYVDEQTAEQIKENRGTLHTPGVDSPFRDRPAEESLRLFREMREGKHPEGSMVLRSKVDMSSRNINLRDPAIYRIRFAEHHRTGDKWCIYPMYDFTHGQSDYLEGITHSICTLEFDVHRPLYDWFIQQLGIFQSHQYEFARLNLTYTMMSKRKLLQCVQEGIVMGWDDPRMPTICGLRRRGYTPESIRMFADKVGVAKRDNVIDLGLLEFCVREDLNKCAERRMAVLDPIKVVITNYPEGQTEMVDCVNNPEDESAGRRNVPFSREIYIERTDFMEEPPKKYYRLSPGKEVRLRYAYLIRCDEVIKNDAGEIVELRCTYDPMSKGGQSSDGRKVKGVIHWVSAEHAVEAEIRLFDRLFTRESLDDIEEGKTFKDYLNPDSLKVVKGYIEPSLQGVSIGSKYQFERIGYFCADKDSTPDKMVFNRTVTLKDSWAKLASK